MATPNDQQPLDFTDEDTIAFLNRQRASFSEARDKAGSESNESERALCGQLMLLSTVLISVNVVILGDSDVLKSLTTAQRILSTLGLALLISSIVTGILYYFKVFASYKNWADAHHKVVERIESKSFSTLAQLGQYIKNTYKHLDIHVRMSWLRVQVACLFSAFAVYLLLVIALLFDLGIGQKIFH